MKIKIEDFEKLGILSNEDLEGLKSLDKSNLVDFDTIRIPTGEELQRIEKYKKFAERWDEIYPHLITFQTEIRESDPTMIIDNVPVFTKKDIHALKGKQKQGKTSLLKAIGAAFMTGQWGRLKSCLKDPRVLWIDTEQQDSDALLIKKDILQMTGVTMDYIDHHLFLCALRTKNQKELKEFLPFLVESCNVDIVIIDGLVDLVKSFNDETESQECIKLLQQLSSDFNCAIITILHENKSPEDHNMRGHLGTMLSQKAATVANCKKSKNDTITCSCEDSRHLPMPTWSIRFNKDGQIEDADAIHRQELEKQKEDNARKKEHTDGIRINTAIQVVEENGGSILRKELVALLKIKLDKGESTVQNIIKLCIDKNLLQPKGNSICLPKE